LEYAAVNYLYWGGRVKRRKRKSEQTKRETQRNYQLVEIESDRASPIIGLRSHHRKFTGISFDENYQSNHVITRQPPRIRSLVKTNPALDPTAYNRTQRPRRYRRLLNYLRNRATHIHHSIADLYDVNDIDRWSRLCFPVLFLLFNASYWPYYIVRPQTFT
jgi:gamma-aminobutyric acid receptor subunit beta